METGWLLVDGEAVASTLRARTPLDRRRAARAARRGEAAAVLRGPVVALGPMDLVWVRGTVAASVRAPRWRLVVVCRPGIVVAVRRGDAERCGIRPGSTVELRWPS